jgi:hypothetical protein
LHQTEAGAERGVVLQRGRGVLLRERLELAERFTELAGLVVEARGVERAARDVVRCRVFHQRFEPRLLERVRLEAVRLLE